MQRSGECRARRDRADDERIGGDLFAIVYEAKSGKITDINASGWAPKAPALRTCGRMKLVTVPGAVAGWAALHHRFGKLPLKDDLAPAIDLARNGFPASEMNARAWSEYGWPYAKVAGFAPVFLPDGHPPAEGEIFENPDLARSLQRVADEGVTGFYQRPIAATITDVLNSLGNPMSKEDLSEISPEW